MADNRQIVIASVPDGALHAGTPGPGVGEVLFRTPALTIGAEHTTGSAEFRGMPEGRRAGE